MTSGDGNYNADHAFDQALRSFHQHDVKSALDAFIRAESHGYDPDVCSAWRWHCWMLLGEFERAWQESDAITTRGAPDPGALWDGQPVAGKRIVVRCLHGYGDAIQFLRYVPLLRRSARNVIVQIHPEMMSLVSGLEGVDSVVTWDHPAALPGRDWDQQIEVTELPRIFRTVRSTIPRKIPYLRVCPSAICLSAARLAPSAKPRVGLLWAASAWNPARSMCLTQLQPLLDSPGFSFYSFQRDPQREQLHSLPPGLTLHDTAAHSPTIADTAADLMNMDLLITVDTMAAHLAGALGRRVWVMLPWDADWRWMLQREDTPWYPTMRLFRQPAPGDWTSVVRRIAGELAKQI